MANLAVLGEPGQGTRTLHNTVSHLKLRNLRHQPQYSDLVFVYKSQVEIYAHRAIVTQYSKYIQQLCTEKQSMEYIGSVNMVIIDLAVLLTPFSESLFYCIMDFMYGQSISISEVEREQLEQLATELEVWDLVSLLKIPANLWNSMSGVDQVSVPIADPYPADNLYNPFQSDNMKMEQRNVEGAMLTKDTLPKLVTEEENSVVLENPQKEDVSQQGQGLIDFEAMPQQGTPDVEAKQSMNETLSPCNNRDLSIPAENHPNNSDGLLLDSDNVKVVSDANTFPSTLISDNVKFQCSGDTSPEDNNTMSSKVNTIVKSNIGSPDGMKASASEDLKLCEPFKPSTNEGLNVNATGGSKINATESGRVGIPEDIQISTLDGSSKALKAVTMCSKAVQVSDQAFDKGIDKANENVKEHYENKTKGIELNGSRDEAINNVKENSNDEVESEAVVETNDSDQILEVDINRDGNNRNHDNTKIVDVDNVGNEHFDNEKEYMNDTTMKNHQSNIEQTLQRNVDVNLEKSLIGSKQEVNIGKPPIGQLIRSKRKRLKPMKYTESSNNVTLKSPASKHPKVQKRASKTCYNTVNNGKSADNNHKFDSEDEDTIVDEAIGTGMEPVVKARRRSRKSEKLNYKCPQCPAVFHNRDEVYNHRAEDHGMYGCGLCKKIYETKELLNVHNHLHSSDNPYITMTTKGEKRYKCDICGEQFKTSTNFFKHMQLSHNLHKPLRCPYCSTSCKYFSQFSKHMDVHTGEKNHSCPNCGMKFNNKYSMLRHRRIHTGEKLHLCDICGKSFKDRQRLKEHRFVHGDMPKFNCDQCGQKFVSPIYLQRHRKSHKKLYECEKCGKRFGRLSHLKSHQRTHDGIKPYACDICGKMYSDPRPLRTHLIKLHDIEQDKIPTSRDCRVDIRLKDPKPVVETLVITEHEITELLQNGNIVSLQSNASNIDICP